MPYSGSKAKIVYHRYNKSFFKKLNSYATQKNLARLYL